MVLPGCMAQKQRHANIRVKYLYLLTDTYILNEVDDVAMAMEVKP